MDLAKLTNGLALVKHGLDELDARIRDELNLCSQLRRKAAAQRQHTQQLHSQVAEAREQLFAQQDEQEDLRTLLNCLIEQTGRARGRKQDMQESIKNLQQQVLDVVEKFEAQSDDFCATFNKVKLEEQEHSVEQQEQAAEAELKAAVEQLQAKRHLLGQQQSTIKGLRQKMSDSKASIQDLKCQIANESSTSNDLMLELEQAQHDGPAAQQLARLKQELSHREEELINQQCSITVQEVELGRAEGDVKQRQQEVARKKAELANLNRTIRALGLPPVDQLNGPAAHETAAAGVQQQQQQQTHPAAFATQNNAAGPNKSAATAHPVPPGMSRPAAVPASQPTWVPNPQAHQSAHYSHGTSMGPAVGPAQPLQPLQLHQQYKCPAPHPAAATSTQQPQQQQVPQQPQQLQQQPKQQPAQQQYYVEEPDDPSQPSYQSAAADTAAKQHHQAWAAEDAVLVEEVGADAAAAGTAHAPENNTALQLALVSSSTSNRDGHHPAAATAGRKRARARMVVSETVVTQTLHQGAGSAPGQVVHKRVVVQEVEESLPSRSGSQLIPSKRTVTIEGTQQMLSKKKLSSHTAKQSALHPRHIQQPHGHPVQAAAAAVHDDTADYMDADIAGPAPAALSFPPVSGNHCSAGMSGGGWSGGGLQPGHVATAAAVPQRQAHLQPPQQPPHAFAARPPAGRQQQPMYQQYTGPQPQYIPQPCTGQQTHMPARAYQQPVPSHMATGQQRQLRFSGGCYQQQQQTENSAQYQPQQRFHISQHQQHALSAVEQQYQSPQSAAGPIMQHGPPAGHGSYQGHVAHYQYPILATKAAAAPMYTRYQQQDHRSVAEPESVEQHKTEQRTRAAPADQHRTSRASGAGTGASSRVAKTSSSKSNKKAGAGKASKGNKGGRATKAGQQAAVAACAGYDDGFGNGNDW